MIRQVNLTVTTTTTLPTARTTTTIVSPASATFQTPSIAVTASTGTTSAIQTKRATGKRAAKVEVVRFDSVETIFKQSDHDDIVQRAKIKDEIKRYVNFLNILTKNPRGNNGVKQSITFKFSTFEMVFLNYSDFND